MRLRLTPQALALFTLATLFASSVFAQPKIEERRITITMGAQRTISAKDIKTFAPSNEDIAEVVYSAQLGTLIVRGKQPGEASLLLFYNNDRQVNYTIVVTEPATSGDDSIPVPARTNIRLDLYFVELNKNNTLRVGLAFPPKLFTTGGTGGSGGGNATPSQLSFFVTLDPFEVVSGATTLVTSLPTLDILHNSGWGKILRHATVMTTNGTNAEFESGGEFNVQVPGTQGGQDLRTVPFGIKMTVTPQYDANSNRVEVVVTSEVSDLFDSGGNLPGRNVTKSRSTANLRLGEAFVIGGVQSRSQSASKSGLPGLSQIPILGVLFGSHSNEERAQENVLIIIPTIVDETAGVSQEVMSTVLKAYHEYDGNISEVRLDKVINESSMSVDDDDEPSRSSKRPKRSGRDEDK